jgi:hypothetical protein
VLPNGEVLFPEVEAELAARRAAWSRMTPFERRAAAEAMVVASRSTLH